MCVKSCLHLIAIAEVTQPELVTLALSASVSQQLRSWSVPYHLPWLAL